MAKKAGPKNVNPSSKGSSPSHNVAGGPGGTFAQKPIPGGSGKSSKKGK